MDIRTIDPVNPTTVEREAWLEDQLTGVSTKELAAVTLGAAAALVCETGSAAIRTVRNGIGALLGLKT